MALPLLLLLTSLTAAGVWCETENVCPLPLDGSCQCSEPLDIEEPFLSAVSSSKPPGLLVQCHNMTGISLHHDIDSIVKFLNGSNSISELRVRDSNLAHLRGLPSGLADLKHLTLDNTNIDLEQIRESSEILTSLKTFKIYREKFTEIPEDFFSDLHGLRNLGLNNVGLKAISTDGLEFLEDSLKELRYRSSGPLTYIRQDGGCGCAFSLTVSRFIRFLLLCLPLTDSLPQFAREQAAQHSRCSRSSASPGIAGLDGQRDLSHHRRHGQQHGGWLEELVHSHPQQ